MVAASVSGGAMRLMWEQLLPLATRGRLLGFGADAYYIAAVHGGGLIGEDEDGGVALLGDGRPIDDMPTSQIVAAVDGSLHPAIAAVNIDAAVRDRPRRT